MSETFGTITVGDVVQIEDDYPDAGFVGAFLLVEEVKGWGVKGYVAQVIDRDNQGRIHLRLNYEQVSRIGNAELVPEDLTVEPT